ncbi:MAG: helix-turn-helix transcriptional regulator [Acidobacteriaceae bacterium]|nr:helix-turn-helix transcriptional regulator [Acidobacteriaceae bacterium]
MDKASEGRYLGRVLTSRTLTNFALVESQYTAGQSLSWHSHDRAFLSIELQGSYVEHCGSSTVYCDVGQVIFHTAGEYHSNDFFENGGRSLNLEILPHFADRLRDYGIDTRSRFTVCSAYFTQLARKLRAEAFRYDSVSELAIEGLALETLAKVLRSRIGLENPRRRDWLARVNTLLHERYRESITLKELAAYARVHPVHLSRAFRKQYDCSISDYVRQLRFASACTELATSDVSIAEIAARNGFSDQSHLCRIVKQHTGMSPREVRRAPFRYH